MGRWLRGRSDDVARLAGGCTNCMQLPDTVKIAPPPNVIRGAPLVTAFRQNSALRDSSAMGLAKLQANSCFRQTLAGYAVENGNAMKTSKASLGVDSEPARPAMAYR